VIRTRFAPSPTGYLHVGGLRTALYNYLFARKNNGKFILRIEDTDQNRKVEGAVENLINTLRWVGLEIDEGKGFGGDFGPYIQSERTELYKEQVQELLNKDKAYHCFCTADRLTQLREQPKKEGQPFGYDRKCRNLSKEEVEKKIASGESYVIRQKIPLDGVVIIDDIIRGKIKIPCSQIDDQVLMKSDGFPTYHLANVVDDHFMKISHIIRGEEWLLSTPKHILLYESFGWKLPIFAHLSLLLNSDRSKLSKRQGDVAVEDYKEKGYLPEGLINFLALLGWNPGNEQEIFSIQELVDQFSLEKVGKSGSIFNVEKLDWMNGLYIRELDIDELWNESKKYLPKNWKLCDEDTKKIIWLIREKINKFTDIPEHLTIFTEDYKISDDASEFINNEDSQKIFHSFYTHLKNIENLDSNIFMTIIKTVQKETGIKGKNLWMTIRIAITGELHGPQINTVAEILGKEICLKRVTALIDK